MTDMQRFGYCSTCVCPLPKDDGRWVLLADAEAAIAAAEQRVYQFVSALVYSIGGQITITHHDLLTVGRNTVIQQFDNADGGITLRLIKRGSDE